MKAELPQGKQKVTCDRASSAESLNDLKMGKNKGVYSKPELMADGAHWNRAYLA